MRAMMTAMVLHTSSAATGANLAGAAAVGAAAVARTMDLARVKPQLKPKPQAKDLRTQAAETTPRAHRYALRGGRGISISRSEEWNR